MPDRLFVPLRTEHYRNFESLKKDVELRGINPNFNEDTVYEGRAVELCHGYNGDSLWGTIDEVWTFSMLTEIPVEIDRHRILPNVTHTVFLDRVAELLGDYDRYIAFAVVPEMEGFHDR